MKIKSSPEDFVVEEFLDLPEFCQTGEYVIYRLRKRGLSTLDVINQLVRKYKIPSRKINFAGLKDKYALTSQYLSIKSNKTREIQEKNFILTPLGNAEGPVGPGLILRNSFKITLRSLEKALIPKLVSELHQVSKYGFPNYFGEQRFGSIRGGALFLAKFLIRGNFEEALKIHLSQWSSEDKPGIKSFKKIVSSCWGNWEQCLKAGAPSSERIILAYLSDHPRDFARAINLIDQRMLFIYVAAYQSYLWNEMASEFIKAKHSAEGLMSVDYSAGEMVFYKSLSDGLFAEFKGTQIPLIDHKVEFPVGKIRDIAEMIIDREGVAVNEFKLNKIKNAFFKSVPRDLIVFPAELEIDGPAADEVYPEKFKLSVSFFLPSGSYATVLLRRIGQKGL